ncbi:9965_t:CDS:2 [Entrophospora sp. SA101]|nr:9965_t:CDS:2 [Entrophospora sp. SA101]
MSDSSTTTLTLQQRMEAIADKLSQSDYEIVCLQEVWVYDNYKLICNKTRKRFPYSRFYSSGVFGSGLVVLSRYPIVEVNFHKYRLNGHPIKVTHGDWYVGKGVASAVVDHPVAGLIEIFNTHVIELLKVGKFPICLEFLLQELGDFNSEPDSILYKLVTTHGQMTDSWASQNTSSSSNVSTTSLNNDAANNPFDPATSITKNGYTCDSPLNTWSNISFKQANHNNYSGERIDYVFYRKTSRFWCSGSRVVFTEKIPELGVSYSDHFGVEAKFTLVNRNKNSVIPLSVWDFEPRETLYELDTNTLKILMRLFTNDLDKSKTTSKIYIFLFYASFLLIFGLILLQILLTANAISQDYQYLGLIFIIINGPIAAVASILGLIGLLFGNEERNILRGLLDELETFLNGKKILESRTSGQITTSEACRTNQRFSSCFENKGTNTGLLSIWL